MQPPAPVANRVKVVSWNQRSDLFLICFPIWLPLIFIFSVYSNPGLLATVCLGLFFVLRESHFGATWFFFMNAENRRWINRRPAIAYLYPALILAALIGVLLTKGLQAAFFLTNLASWFHVTRQSVGVFKLYSSSNAEGFKQGSFWIYFFSTLFLLIGFFRFYSGVELSADQFKTLIVAGGAACLLATAQLLISLREQNLSPQFFLSALTGMLIYYPYCFVTDAEHALIIGVGMHWLQYLSLQFPIYTRRLVDLRPKIGPTGTDAEPRGLWEDVLTSRAQMISFVALYVMGIAVLDTLGQSRGGGLSLFTSFLVLASYNLHFYCDAFIWKFSNAHIRKEVGAYLFRPEAVPVPMRRSAV